MAKWRPWAAMFGLTAAVLVAFAPVAAQVKGKGKPAPKPEEKKPEEKKADVTPTATPRLALECESKEAVYAVGTAAKFLFASDTAGEVIYRMTEDGLAP